MKRRRVSWHPAPAHNQCFMFRCQGLLDNATMPLTRFTLRQIEAFIAVAGLGVMLTFARFLYRRGIFLRL